MLTIDLNGKTALITGASRGIGRAIARLVAEAGAAVAINYRDRAVQAAEVAEEIARLGRKALPIAADISEASAVGAMITRIEAELGGIDILVNNAGVALTRNLDDLTETDFDQTIAVNLKSAFLCTQAVLPGMRARRFGRIVNISSGAARGGGIIGPHYNAAKAGLEGLTRGYAARLAKEGITVNAVAPSLIATDMIAARAAQLASAVPVGRLGTPEEVAQAVLMVIGNAYITGQTVPVNGGAHFS
jgi:3-oxoacyl-[acyl-carrier protein] reductase